MAVCGCTSGMLFWKKPCDRIALDSCASCGTALCASHARRPKPGRFYCPACASAQTDTDTDSDSGSDSSSSSSNWFSDRSGNTDGERAAAAAASSSLFSSSDTGSSDSSSSDSGGGDSGSSTD